MDNLDQHQTYYSDANEGSIITSLISQLRYTFTISLSSLVILTAHQELAWIFLESPFLHLSSNLGVCSNALPISCPIRILSLGAIPWLSMHPPIYVLPWQKQ